MFDIAKNLANHAAQPITALGSIASWLLAFAPALVISTRRPRSAVVARRGFSWATRQPTVPAAERQISIPASTLSAAAQWAKVGDIAIAAQKSAVHMRELHSDATVKLEAAEFALDRLFADVARLMSPTPEMIAAHQRVRSGDAWKVTAA
jgi:hypothetical protein